MKIIDLLTLSAEKYPERCVWISENEQLNYRQFIHDVLKLRGTVNIEYTLAKLGAEKLWKRLTTQPFTAGLGALTGNQAIQEVAAGLEAIYLSGWQVAADANLAGQMYPDQSLY